MASKGRCHKPKAVKETLRAAPSPPPRRGHRLSGTGQTALELEEAESSEAAGPAGAVKAQLISNHATNLSSELKALLSCPSNVFRDYPQKYPRRVWLQFCPKISHLDSDAVTMFLPLLFFSSFLFLFGFLCLVLSALNQSLTLLATTDLAFRWHVGLFAMILLTKLRPAAAFTFL